MTHPHTPHTMITIIVGDTRAHHLTKDITRVPLNYEQSDKDSAFYIYWCTLCLMTQRCTLFLYCLLVPHVALTGVGVTLLSGTAVRVSAHSLGQFPRVFDIRECWRPCLLYTLILLNDRPRFRAWDTSTDDLYGTP